MAVPDVLGNVGFRHRFRWLGWGHKDGQQDRARSYKIFRFLKIITGRCGVCITGHVSTTACEWWYRIS